MYLVRSWVDMEERRGERSAYSVMMNDSMLYSHSHVVFSLQYSKK